MIGVNEFKIVGVAALPIFELRGAIPLGCQLLGMSDIGKVYFLALLGNLIPVLPYYCFLSIFFITLRI